MAFSLASGALLLLAIRDLIPEVGLVSLVEDPGAMIRVGPENADLLRWGYLTDMFGSYLPLAPVVLALRYELGKRGPDPIADLAAVSGLMFVTIGAIGAVVLATVLPDLIRSFASASGPERETVGLTFTTLIEAIHRGLWQTLELIPAAVWFLITGFRLRRAGAVVAAWAAVALAVFGFATSLGWMIDVPMVVVVALATLAVLFPLWILWAGLWLLRGAPLVRR